jgi:hypothetical protein
VGWVAREVSVGWAEAELAEWVAVELAELVAEAGVEAVAFHRRVAEEVPPRTAESD